MEKYEKYLKESIGEMYAWEITDIKDKYNYKIRNGSLKVNKIIDSYFSKLAVDIDDIIENETTDIKDANAKSVIKDTIFSSIPNNAYNEWPKWYVNLYRKYSRYSYISVGGPKPKKIKNYFDDKEVIFYGTH